MAQITPFSADNRIRVMFFAVGLLLLGLSQFAASTLYETLNISGLLDVDQMFFYANILLAALIPVVLISLGFALARFVVGFVQRVFNGLG